MATFTPNPAGIAALLTDPSGPVARDMLRRGEEVLALSRTLLARSEWHGDLDASLRVVPLGVGVAVGSDLPYCVYLHNGTGPQHITSDGAFGSVPAPTVYRKRPPLGGGSTFVVWAREHDKNPWKFAQHVFEFGTAPNPFLRNAMEAARV
jgi:hypothetical protein